MRLGWGLGVRLGGAGSEARVRLGSEAGGGWE